MNDWKQEKCATNETSETNCRPDQERNRRRRLIMQSCFLFLGGCFNARLSFM